MNSLIKINKKYKSREFLSVLQCTSSYPTDDQDVNLKTLNKLVSNKKITADTQIILLSLVLKSAFTLGAKVLEFHFTDTRK